jgi:hypothetical protein
MGDSFGIFSFVTHLWYPITYFVTSQAGGIDGVTLRTPPKGNLFATFHRLGDSPMAIPAPAPGPAPNHPFAPFGLGGTPGMFNPYTFMTPPPWMMTGMPSYPSPTTPTPHSVHKRHNHYDDVPSSDPPDDSGANPYPEIRSFLEKLDKQHPRRLLLPYVEDFEQKDFYHIDEIVKLSMECLTGAEFHLSAGNAQFIVDAAKAEMKRIDRSQGKKRSR